MIKLVASDLDGTLLHNYQQTVPKEIYDTIKACLLYTSDAADE